MTRAPRRRRRTLSVLAAVAFALTSVAALPSSSAETLEDTLLEDTRFPGQGLPGYAQNPTSPGYWVPPQAGSLNFVTAARQWANPPTFQAVGNNLQTTTFVDNACTGRLGEGVRNRRDFRAPVVFVNTDVDADSTARFGRTQAFTVRTVAFGSVPVEADIALEQPRNPQGAVLPAIVSQRAITFCAGGGPFPSRPPGGGNQNNAQINATLSGPAAVRVTALRLDGVDVGPLPQCTAAGATLSLSAPDYYAWDPEPTAEERPPNTEDIEGILSTRYFNLSTGGLLTGTLDVPQFAGCTTADGDDLGPLLTATVSGDGNPVTVRSEGLPPTDGLLDNSSPDSPTIPDCPWRSNVCDTRIPQLKIPEAPPSP